MRNVHSRLPSAVQKRRVCTTKGNVAIDLVGGGVLFPLLFFPIFCVIVEVMPFVAHPSGSTSYEYFLIKTVIHG